MSSAAHRWDLDVQFVLAGLSCQLAEGPFVCRAVQHEENLHAHAGAVVLALDVDNHTGRFTRPGHRVRPRFSSWTVIGDHT